MKNRDTSCGLGGSGEAPLQRRNCGKRRLDPFEAEREKIVSDFFGAGGIEALAMLHPQARPLAPLVAKTLCSLQRPEMAYVGILRAHWMELFPEAAVASAARPVRVERNCLEIRVSNPTYLFALNTPVIKRHLTAKLADLTHGGVSAVRFRL